MLTPSRLIAIKDLRKEYENLQISYDELKESADRGNINRDEYLIKESTILGKFDSFESFKKLKDRFTIVLRLQEMMTILI